MQDTYRSIINENKLVSQNSTELFQLAKPRSDILCDVSVLILEDDCTTAAHVAYSVMSNGGIVVGPAMSNDEAAELIERNRVDMAILDVALIGETSFPTAGRLLEAEVPFVFHSSTDPDFVHQKFPCVPFLSKGVSHQCIIGQLVRRIGELKSEVKERSAPLNVYPMRSEDRSKFESCTA